MSQKRPYAVLCRILYFLSQLVCFVTNCTFCRHLYFLVQGVPFDEICTFWRNLNQHCLQAFCIVSLSDITCNQKIIHQKLIKIIIIDRKFLY